MGLMTPNHRLVQSQIDKFLAQRFDFFTEIELQLDVGEWYDKPHKWYNDAVILSKFLYYPYPLSTIKNIHVIEHFKSVSIKDPTVRDLLLSVRALSVDQWRHPTRFKIERVENRKIYLRLQINNYFLTI